MEDKELRELLIFVLNNLKEQRQAFSAVLAEVAAIRDALTEIGPAYASYVDRHRANNAAKAKPVLDAISAEYEKRIEQLR